MLLFHHFFHLTSIVSNSFHTVNYLHLSNLLNRNFFYKNYSFVIEIALDFITAELLALGTPKLGLTIDNVELTIDELYLIENLEPIGIFSFLSKLSYFFYSKHQFQNEFETFPLSFFSISFFDSFISLSLIVILRKFGSFLKKLG